MALVLSHLPGYSWILGLQIRLLWATFLCLVFLKVSVVELCSCFLTLAVWYLQVLVLDHRSTHTLVHQEVSGFCYDSYF